MNPKDLALGHRDPYPRPATGLTTCLLVMFLRRRHSPNEEWASAAAPTSCALKADMPEVEQTTRLVKVKFQRAFSSSFFGSGVSQNVFKIRLTMASWESKPPYDGLDKTILNKNISNRDLCLITFTTVVKSVGKGLAKSSPTAESIALLKKSILSGQDIN